MRIRFKLRKLWLSLLLLVGATAIAIPGIQEVMDGNVAKVGNTEYATIEEAIDAWGPGKTLTLLSNVTTTKTVEVEVNATKSTQNWTLDLGDHTWTASGCNAFQLYAAGGTVMSQNYGLKIYANQNGGITASGKYCIECKYDNSTAGYRPRLEIHGGTYKGNYAIYYYASTSNNTNISNGPSTYIFKSNDGSEPVFNGKLGLFKCPIYLYAGYFNDDETVSAGWFQTIPAFNTYPVSSTANTNLYGGHFKTINAFPSASNNKGIIFGTYKVFVKSDASIDVINGAPATYEAKATKTLLLSSNQAVNYSDYVYYEKANDALNKYSSGIIEIILSEGVTATQDKSFRSGTLTIDTSAEGSDYTGNITLTGTSAKFIIKFPEGKGHYGVTAGTGQLHVVESVADGVVTRTYSVQNVSNPEAKVDNTNYSTVYDAFYAIDGTTDNKTIVLQKDVTNAGIVTNGTAVNAAGKTVATFDLNGKSIGIGSVAAGNNADYTLTIIDSSQDKTGTVTNSDASLFMLALTGINDYSGTYTLKIQAGTWQFDPSNVVINGETHNMVDEGYVAHDNGNGTWTVGEVDYVAAIGDKKFTTLQGAFDAAIDGDIVKLLKDYDASSENDGNYPGSTNRNLWLAKGVTVDGDNHTLTVTNRGIGVQGASDNIDVTFKNITIKNNSASGRCVDTRGKIGSLTLDNATLSTEGQTASQPLTIGGNQADAATVKILNGSTVATSEDGKYGYAITTFNPVNMTIDGSTIKGWACLNIKAASSSAGSKGSVFTITNSELTSKNVYAGTSNAYSVIKVEDVDITVNITNTKINVDGDKNSEAIVGFQTNNTKESIVNMGEGNEVTFTGTTDFAQNNNSASKLSISGGVFNQPVPEDCCAEGFIPVKLEEGKYSVKVGSYVAQIDDVKYETLEAAFAAANDGETITLLANCTGNGIKAPQGKFTTGLTVDFVGHTYTVDGATVGSTGTETNGFQLLKDNKITFKNGTITSEKAKILVQNYSDLTLEGMTLTLNNANYTSAYTLSNNNGNIVIDGTTINANEAGGFAFDVCRYSSYPSVGVTVKGESKINGDIEVSASGSDAKDGFSLMLESCTLTGEIVLDASAKAAMAATPEKATVSKNNSLGTIAAPEEYKWKDNGDETSSLVLKTYVAKIGEVQYETLAEAVAAVPADGTETTITMIANEMIDVVGSAITIPANKNVVIDLNGFQVVGTAAGGSTSALITNKGTLTIKDSSDTNKDGTGTGQLISGATTTWNYEGDGNYAGSYASNAITNSGTLTIESGYIENLSTGSATYAVDNNSSGADAILTVNGGVVKAKSVAVRQFANSTAKENTVNVAGGTVTAGYSGMWIQLPGSDATKAMKASLNVTGGTLTGGSYAFYDYSFGNSFDATQYNLSGGTFNGSIFSYGANINITDGTYNGDVAIKQAKPSTVAISGGKFGGDVYTYGDNASEGFITGGVFAINTYEYEGNTYDCDWLNCLAEDYVVSDNTDPETKDAYPYTVRKANYICAIGTTKYETLAEAVAAAGTAETTITLLTEAATDGVINGNGVKVPSGSNITFDLNGLTYNVSNETVGSSTTETQGFQLLKDSNITFKNGTLKATSPTAQMLIQNYANLTLEDVNLDGTGLSGWAYALSNNSGTINLTGSTSITAKEGGRAFDTCKFGNYAIPTVNINTTGAITGPIEATGGKLNIENGKFNVTWVTDSHYAAGDIQIKGGVFTEEPAEEYCAEGYVPTENTDEATKEEYPYAVKTKEEAGIFELIDGEPYERTVDIQAKKVTYKRTFPYQVSGNLQCWVVPFDYTITEDDLQNLSFYKIHLISAVESAEGGLVEDDSKVYLYYQPVEAGTVLKANKPYFVKVNEKTTENKTFTFEAEDVTLKAKNDNCLLSVSTSRFNFDFFATYVSGFKPEAEHWLGVNGNGSLFWNKPTSELASSYRWYIKVTGNEVDYAKITIEFIEESDDITNINNHIFDDKSEVLEGYYTIGGVKLDVPAKGVNIVRFTDGTTKKVYIK